MKVLQTLLWLSARRAHDARTDLTLGPFRAHCRLCGFAFDMRHQPVAFSTWARPSAAGASRLERHPSYRLQPWEWNEGGPLWLLHVVHFRYRLRGVMLYIRPHVAETGEPVFRQRRGGPRGAKASMMGLPPLAYARRTATSYTQTLPRSHFLVGA